MTSDTLYLKTLGARIRSEANDLKRTPEALAAELGMSEETVAAVLAGKSDQNTAQDLLRKMTQAYPISLADIWVDEDDTDHGVRVMTAESSRRSARVFDRLNSEGNLTEYYEYRDTAMSRGAPFKPEWILELRTVQDADPYNPDVAYNNGHLMHQTTFFIGPVNFYWQTGGKKYCAEMDTGDSNYITPFVPHSFASRDPDQPGLIIAVTFSGQVGRAMREFMTIGAASANRAAGDLRDEKAFHQRLARHCAAESISAAFLQRQAVENGMDAERARQIAKGEQAPTAAEIDVLATILSVRPSDLMVHPLSEAEEVIVQQAREQVSRPYPDGNAPTYRMTELARSRQQPYMKGFEVTVLGGQSEMFEHALHEYIYNYGEEPVELIWEPDRTAVLNPGDSACIRPLVRHRFDRPEGAQEGHLAVIRVPGQLTDQTLDEFASFATAGRNRVAAETGRWF